MIGPLLVNLLKQKLISILSLLVSVSVSVSFQNIMLNIHNIHFDFEFKSTSYRFRYCFRIRIRIRIRFGNRNAHKCFVNILDVLRRNRMLSISQIIATPPKRIKQYPPFSPVDE